jgi:hypothetical protein
MQDGTVVLPANPSLASRGSAPPLTGRGLGAGGPAGSGSTSQRQLPALQFTAGIGSSSPSWADIVRNGPRLIISPPAGIASASASTTADFLALYDRCSSSSLKTRINISNSAGRQEIILMCQIPTSAASAPRRHRPRCPRQRGQAVSATVLSCTSHPPILSALQSTQPKTPPASAACAQALDAKVPADYLATAHEADKEGCQEALRGRAPERCGG